MENNKSFEEMMQNLESIAKDLESGDLSLDDSVKKFEEGMKISKECSKILENAEKKITILTKDSEGNLKEETGMVTIIIIIKKQANILLLVE